MIIDYNNLCHKLTSIDIHYFRYFLWEIMDFMLTTV